MAKQNYISFSVIWMNLCIHISISLLQKGLSNYKSHGALSKGLEMVNYLELHPYFLLIFICGL